MTFLGGDLGSVAELHAAQFEGLPGDPAQRIEPYVSLLHEEHRCVSITAVGGEITGAEAKLTLCARRDCVVWEAKEERESEFKLPVEGFSGLAQANAQNGVRIGVLIIGTAAKPVP